MLQTKILVLRKNRLLIGALFVLLLILLLVLLLHDKRQEADNYSALLQETYQAEATYHAGVYTSAISLNDSVLVLELVLDTNHINSVRLVNLEESVTTMYPLMEPALLSLSEQLVSGVSLEKVVLSDDKKYTQLLLMEVIKKTLEKAAVTETELTSGNSSEPQITAADLTPPVKNN